MADACMPNEILRIGSTDVVFRKGDRPAWPADAPPRRPPFPILVQPDWVREREPEALDTQPGISDPKESRQGPRGARKHHKTGKGASRPVVRRLGIRQKRTGRTSRCHTRFRSKKRSKAMVSSPLALPNGPLKSQHGSQSPSELF